MQWIYNYIMCACTVLGIKPGPLNSRETVDYCIASSAQLFLYIYVCVCVHAHLCTHAPLDKNRGGQRTMSRSCFSPTRSSGLMVSILTDEPAILVTLTLADQVSLYNWWLSCDSVSLWSPGWPQVVTAFSLCFLSTGNPLVIFKNKAEDSSIDKKLSYWQM